MISEGTGDIDRGQENCINVCREGTVPSLNVREHEYTSNSTSDKKAVSADSGAYAIGYSMRTAARGIISVAGVSSSVGIVMTHGYAVFGSV